MRFKCQAFNKIVESVGISQDDHYIDELCGKSDRPSDTAMFAQTSQSDPTETLFRFAEEVLGGTNTEANANVLEFESTHGRRS